MVKCIFLLTAKIFPIITFLKYFYNKGNLFLSHVTRDIYEVGRGQVSLFYCLFHSSFS